MQAKFTRQAKAALQIAESAARSWKHSYIGTEHILVGLLKEQEGTAGKILEEFGVDPEKLETLITQLIAPSGVLVAEKSAGYSPRAQKIKEQAVKEAEKQKEEQAGTEHLLLAMLRETDCVGTRLLYTMGVNIQKLYSAVLSAAEIDSNSTLEELQMQKKQKENKNSTTPTLDQYSRDLTAMAADGKLDPVVGREKEIARLIQILSRRTKNNPCLVGEPGVGKTAIVEGLAQRIISGMVPDSVKNKRVVVLDLSGMVAGSKYRGEFEERIRNVINEVRSNQGILLFIDELHTIIGAGGAEGALDASNILKPSLSRGEIQLIGATTLEEYRKYIEKDAALERRFQPVTVEEPSEEETLEILKGLRPYYEQHHGVAIEDSALEAAVKMSVRYINDRFLPDKAIDIIDEAASKVRLGGYHVTPEMDVLELKLREIQNDKEKAVKAADLSMAKELQARQREIEAEIAGYKEKEERKLFDKNQLVAGLKEVTALFEEADGIVVASPVYFASANATLIATLDRLFFSTSFDKTMKVGASVVCARRGGCSATFDELNKYFTISNMPIAASQYWNCIHGRELGEADRDEEGKQTMRVLARNMTFLMKSIELGKKQFGLPEKEAKIPTNFIR